MKALRCPRHRLASDVKASQYLQCTHDLVLKLCSFPPVPHYSPIYSHNGPTEQAGHQHNDARLDVIMMMTFGQRTGIITFTMNYETIIVNVDKTVLCSVYITH